ncbi:MAG: hypothetical protein E8G75_01240 [Sulfitobacter sp. SK025]|nr:MAG: hypothetical protein E8G75_01240 [Sulfitobacter sp. SK025]
MGKAVFKHFDGAAHLKRPFLLQLALKRHIDNSIARQIMRCVPIQTLLPGVIETRRLGPGDRRRVI